MKTIKSDRLILRNWTIEDADNLFEYAKSELVGPNAGWKPHKTVEASKKIIETFIRDDDVFAIELKENGKIIGSIGIRDRTPDESIKEKKQVEVGYVLNPIYWGNGYIPEAVERVKKYCFEELGIDILWCGHFDYNINSKRVNEKCGFKYQFTKEQILGLLDDKKVKTLYYMIENEMEKCI